ncbi:two component regulator [Nitzschia inconspicua]|uniref:Two component regulator n=1 Tax=Nitzschia inconspicua TaxID=303405 RepID=A0A9K3Q1W1_9STRA|nr:two component regulator [Nitzschia inconspicua]
MTIQVDWKTDGNSKMDASIVGPGFLDSLDTIPEDISVAAAALQLHHSPQSVGYFSTASAVASSDSGHVCMEVVENGHARNIHSKRIEQSQTPRRGKRPRHSGGSVISATGAAIAGGDNVSDTHASLGGVGDSFERLPPPSEEAPKQNARGSIFCTKRASLFYVVVWVLLAVIGVGIYFIVTKVSHNSNANSAGNPTTTQPTVKPVFPPYEFEGESFSPSEAPSYNQEDIMDLDAVLRNIPGVDPTKIDDKNTPEGQCRHWLTHIDKQMLRVDQVGEKRVEQRFILCLFYYYMNGDDWSINSWMNGDLHECDWYGITCDANDVVAIDLDNKNLNGTIPSAIESLSSLHILRLQNNAIAGKIPDTIFETLDGLRWLDLSDNALTGNIPSISDDSSSSLEVLYLKGNQLGGMLPFFPTLQRVRAQRNLLTSIDARFASSGQSLLYLYVYDNLLSGSLPSTWDTPNLRIIDMGFNDLEGPIPQDLWDLPSLNSLIVDNNQITGNLPTSSSCRTLSQVWVNGNQLDGSIPFDFGANWTNLTSLKLQENNLTGMVSLDHCYGWPNAAAAPSNPISEGAGWELEADCNQASMECECCTQCFPIGQSRYLRKGSDLALSQRSLAK